MKTPEKPVLQYRWALRDDAGGRALVYFGLRNPPLHGRNYISLDQGMAALFEKLDGRPASELPEELLASRLFAELVAEGVVVDAAERRGSADAQSRQSCVTCVADDVMLPGLEFDERGVCAFCQCYEKARESGYTAGPGNQIDDEELLRIARENTDSRFDAMVLCTGGKDSIYLLWYLAKKLGLRVLAVSWNMPYTNDTCKENIQRALKVLPDVELIERTLPWNMVRDAMRGQFAHSGLPCLCPTVAHVLFYPLAAQERIPLVMHGVEDVQLAVMSYVMEQLGSKDENPQAPASMRQQTLGFLHLLAKTPEPETPYAFNADFLNYQRGIRASLPSIYAPLDRLLDQAQHDESMFLPQLRRLKTNESYGSWKDVAELMHREMNWRMPPGHKALLHTSCRIEQVKDYCQYHRFRNMRSTFFPQSIVEIGAAVFFGLLTREEALAEVEALGYHGEPAPLAGLLDDLGMAEQQAHDVGAWGEARFSLCDCCREE